jgi:branched-chain amino acid transport system ATP-binding protein
MSTATTAIAVIRDEHRSIASVLKGLVNHVGEVRAGRMTPDFPLFAAMFDYIEAVPERIHHPKEDEYLFRFLRARCPEARAVLDDLEAQHVQGAEDLARLRRDLESFRDGGPLAPFDQALVAYAEFQWEHMGKEENVVLPLAEEHLTAEDWQIIDAAFRTNRDKAW